MWITTNLKILKEMGISDNPTRLLKNLYMQVKNNGLVQFWERSTKKAAYCHLDYLTYIQGTSCKMPGWMNHKLESRFSGEISITSDTQMIPP